MDELPAGGRSRGLGVSDRAVARRRLTLSIPARLAPFRRTLGTTAGLVVATTLNSATGFAFWWIAARQFPPEAVGLAGAAVSAMLLLSQISVLGLGTTLAGVLHREPRAGSLAITAMLVAGGAGTFLALAFGLIAPTVFPELTPISGTPLTLLVFVAGVGLTALASVLDQVLVSVFRNLYQLLRNSVFAFGRLGILVVAAVVLAPAGMVIYGAWTLGVVLSLGIVFVVAHNAKLSRGIRPLMWRALGLMAREAFSHHVLNLSRSASVWLLPLLVTVVLSREQNASFYVALLLANFVALIGKEATFTLYVVGARAPAQLWRHVRLTLAISLATALLGTALLTLAGRPLLTAFGATYADDAFPAVAILALSCLPLAVKDHWVAIQRVQGSVATAAVIGVAFLVVELAAAGIGAANGGLVGLAVARLIVLVAQAALLAPVVYRWLFPGTVVAGPTAAPPAAGELDA